jgi:hypothetical protein
MTADAAAPRNSAAVARVRGRPFAPGNRGRPPGTRCRATLAAEALLDGEAERLTRQAITMALAGDPAALRLCLERIIPPRRERPAKIELPALRTAADSIMAMGAILAAVAAGEVTPGEASEMAKLVDVFVRALEVTEIEQRLRAIEARQDAARQRS